MALRSDRILKRDNYIFEEKAHNEEPDFKVLKEGQEIGYIHIKYLPIKPTAKNQRDFRAEVINETYKQLAIFLADEKEPLILYMYTRENTDLTTFQDRFRKLTKDLFVYKTKEDFYK